MIDLTAIFRTILTVVVATLFSVGGAFIVYVALMAAGVVPAIIAFILILLISILTILMEMTS